MVKISVVIPAMNEEEGIGPTLDAIPRAKITERGWDLEVIVVDGESRDRTVPIAKEKGAIVIVEPRKGYGRAYKTGFARATGDVIVTGDADLTYPFEDIVEYVDMLLRENLDFINGNRFGMLEKGAMSAKHKVGNAILTGTCRVLFFVNVKDSQSGMWIFRRSILKDIVITSDGMPMSEEIKIEAFRNPRIKAKEIPIKYKVRVGEVKLASWKDGRRNLFFLFRKRFGLLEKPKPEPAGADPTPSAR
ncbi:MAG TPA: glycosyltransferase family 2 protein [Candidatus Thermoplasmatota archaeon]|nr:glycosyltransferase family 2 protein [Candidatus Thermoplasmatota archaeon]